MPTISTFSLKKRLRRELNQQGMLHHILPLLFVVVFAIIGVGYLVYTHAASATAYEIVGVASKCINNNDSVKADYNPINLYQCDDTGAQGWSINGTATSPGTIVNSNGYCLDVYHAGVQPRTLVDLYHCNGTVAQEWTVTPIASRSGYSTITNPHSGLCLDDKYSGAANGNQIWIYACNGTAAQQWKLIPQTSTTTPAPTPPVTTASCSTVVDTPGGADPWGGCFPGANNTGVPGGIKPVTVNASSPHPVALPSDNSGWAFSSGDGVIVANAATAAIDGVSSTGVELIGNTSLVIKDSTFNGTIQNDGTGSLTIENSTINGGNQWTLSTVASANLTIQNSNLYGGEHEVNCQGSNCTVENSWLHDNANGLAAGAHQNGFFADGGSNYTLEHNSVFCTGGCTADISFIPNGNISNATVDKNLFVASPTSSYCLYPSSDPPAKPGIVSQMTITNNVFQKGVDGKCGIYGPVYGWDRPNTKPGTDGYDNVWSGNTWDDETALNP